VKIPAGMKAAPSALWRLSICASVLLSAALGCHHDAEGAASSGDGGSSLAADGQASEIAASSSAHAVLAAAGSAIDAAPSVSVLANLAIDAGPVSPLPPNLGIGADGGLKPGFRRPKLEAADLATIFAKVPELARFAADVHLYDPGDANGVHSRSSASIEGITFTSQPLLWVPETETELLVVVAHTKSTGIIAALYPLPNDTYRLASSFLLQNDLSPVALAFNPHSRKELLWTTCWGCAGGQGHVSVRDDHRVVIVQD
jgi:hypothetical protein